MVGGGVALKAAAFIAAGVVATGVGYEGARELSPPSRQPEAVVPATTAAVRPAAPIVAPVLRAPAAKPRAAAATEKKKKAREARGRAIAPGQVSKPGPAGAGQEAGRLPPRASGRLRRAR